MSKVSVKLLMPNWDYVLMTDKTAEDMVKEHFPAFYKTYINLEYNIMRADALRYMFLYLYGGVYMDLDIELMKPLDNLLGENADLYLVKSGNVGSVYTNSFMASKPRCDLWLDCLDEIKRPYEYWVIGKHLKVMYRTGPLMLTRVVNKNKYQYHIKTIPKELIMPCNSCDPKPCTKPGAYTKALEGSSWCGWDSFFYTGCICNWKLILFLFVLFVLFVLFISKH